MIDTTDIALKEDELVMTKQDVLDMINGLIKRSKRGKKNIWSLPYRATLIGFKTTIEIMPHQVVQMFWSDILKFFQTLITYNAMEKEKKELGDKSPLQKTFYKLKQDVKDGNW